MGQQTMLGALAGRGPDVAMGLPPSCGPSLFDDFVREANTPAGYHGDLAWEPTTIGGAPAYSSRAPAASTETGILRIATTGTTAQGGTLTLGATTAPLAAAPQAGTIWACKLRMVTGTTAYTLLSGFASSTTASPTGATVGSFLGVRSDPTTNGNANLWGVIRAGAVETIVDLGISCHGSTWQTVGFQRLPDGTVQFYAGYFDDRDRWGWVPIGGVQVATNMPTVGMRPCAIGLINQANSSRVAEIDWWAWGGRVAR